ncbi:uncharacterized protein [Argopecten irradians]|uniref:uncharacterized protein n=1 Tax=Argopecten irradians TaxID=31199 RepID=UPI003716E203
MASKIPDTVISVHNDMVLRLDESILPTELEKLKLLLKDDPLTAKDIDRIKTVQKLFLCLMDKAFISYGDYEKIVPKLILVKPSLRAITDRHIKDINKYSTQSMADVTISMDKPVYQAKEGGVAFLMCSVCPKPDHIVWKKSKSAKPSELVPVDNRKYFYGIAAPTLVIKDTYKRLDEAHYQCTVMAKGKTTVGKVVQLQVTGNVSEKELD